MVRIARTLLPLICLTMLSGCENATGVDEEAEKPAGTFSAQVTNGPVSTMAGSAKVSETCGPGRFWSFTFTDESQEASLTIQVFMPLARRLTTGIYRAAQFWEAETGFGSGFDTDRRDDHASAKTNASTMTIGRITADSVSGQFSMTMEQSRSRTFTIAGQYQALIVRVPEQRCP